MNFPNNYPLEVTMDQQELNGRLLRGAMTNDIGMMEAALGDGANLAAVREIDGASVLMLAQTLKAIDFLLSQPGIGEVINAVNRFGANAIMVHLRGGRAKIIQALLDAGTDPEYIAPGMIEGMPGRTALSMTSVPIGRAPIRPYPNSARIARLLQTAIAKKTAEREAALV